ncbi:AAA family ATPase [Cognatiyoonia sp. IB215182]|uniref:AAA family ATPase n=1 Tax=Cognatiyoonia sp. IB215182 TaxID=3097353 RepID=UPI002A15543D|nr:AAA family ATPase [Cognatiyoonia sp. IB215182]MDX8354841.1 AAA family ATPase [Cognatiyoonia sp. IB215182]
MDDTVEGSEGQAVKICSVRSVHGVNALAGGQEMAFSDQGITIVYGDNGSGKSGYCRVLKHACRTRDSKFEIHPNIDETDETPQSADIHYRVGATSATFTWYPDAEQVPPLAQVSIFDARSANTHVQAENNVAYTPFPMRVLERLGDLCDVLKDRLETRIGQIQEKTPLAIANHQLSDGTAAGKFLNGLTARSDLSTLQLLCELKDDERRKLETLRTDLSQDPQKLISALKAQKQRVDAIIDQVRTLTTSLSADSIAQLSELMSAHREAAAAAELASKNLFDASPLPEIGSDTWRALWEAARAFSDNVVAPEKRFPEAKADDDLCVLCQQPLGEDAVKRFETFETFIKSTTKANEQRAVVALEERKRELTATLVSEEAVATARAFLNDELSLPELSVKLTDWLSAANTKLMGFLENGPPASVDSEHPKAALDALSQEFANRIAQAEAVLDPDDRTKLLADQKELEDRVMLGNIAADVEAEIDRLKQIDALKAKAKTTARTSVTNKNKELSELLVTGALRSRFAREITKLDLNTIPMELNKTRDRKAQSFFRVEFVGYPGQPLGEILSEGEHRCVALAAFLAELVTSRDYSGIVFDDPMSSLDHIYRERVAKRLAEEAQHRQVVIFTHDLGFLFEVIREAEAIDISLHFQHVKRRGKTPGYITADLPLKAKTAPALVAALRTELKELKGQLDTVSETRRVILVKGIIEQLREAWDQVIADLIAPVLGRFDNQIKGNSLFKLLILTEADVDIITKARGRLSDDLHNAAGALNPAEVTHDELSAEVTAIHDFIEDLKKRRSSG